MEKKRREYIQTEKMNIETNLALLGAAMQVSSRESPSRPQVQGQSGVEFCSEPYMSDDLPPGVPLECHIASCTGKVQTNTQKQKQQVTKKIKMTNADNQTTKSII